MLSTVVSNAVVIHEQVHDLIQRQAVGVNQRVAVSHEQFVADHFPGLHPHVAESLVAVGDPLLCITTAADEDGSHAGYLAIGILYVQTPSLQ